MKRILPVLLGALAGAIGLPILMFACAWVAHLVFPRFIELIATSPRAVMFFLTGVSGREIIPAGAILGACSVILWRGERTFWPRLGIVMCALGVSASAASALKQLHRGFAIHYPGLFLVTFVLYLPLFIWAFALLFFAILTKRRVNPPLP